MATSFRGTEDGMNFNNLLQALKKGTVIEVLSNLVESGWITADSKLYADLLAIADISAEAAEAAKAEAVNLAQKAFKLTYVNDNRAHDVAEVLGHSFKNTSTWATGKSGKRVWKRSWTVDGIAVASPRAAIEFMINNV